MNEFAEASRDLLTIPCEMQKAEVQIAFKKGGYMGTMCCLLYLCIAFTDTTASCGTEDMSDLCPHVVTYTPLQAELLREHLRATKVLNKYITNIKY